MMRNKFHRVGAVIAIGLICGAPAARAQDTRTLFCLRDGTQIVAERFETREGKFLLHVPGGAAPLEYPASNIKGINTACAPAAAAPRFGIHGSNTIGERLMPMLIEAYSLKHLKTRPQAKPGKPEEQEFTLHAGETTRAVIDLRAHGSGTATKGLLSGEALIGMASRRLKKDEAEAITAQFSVDPLAPGNEHVLGLDGLAVIVNPANPVKALTLEQIARFFSGEYTSWQAVGGPDRPVKVFRRDDKSGTYDTFNTLVLKPFGVKVRDDATRYESSENLSASVTADPDAIGFIGLPYVNKSRALNIASSCGLTSSPSRFTIKTEEYPLARRLYLYTTGAPTEPVARALLSFALSDEAQPVITEAGYTDQAIEHQSDTDLEHWLRQLLGNPNTGLEAGKDVGPDALKVILTTAAAAHRTSVALRFDTNSSELDTRARQDVARLVRYLRSPAMAGKRVHLVGFADATGTWVYNRDLAARRAGAVAAQIRQAGGTVAKTNILALSYFAPVACNDTDDGRAKNRRVEVWIER